MGIQELVFYCLDNVPISNPDMPKQQYTIGYPEKNRPKNMFFKNWLDTRPKMETHDPNVYPTILGGVSRGFWTPFLNWVARSAIFWHLKTGTFAKSVRFQVPKNGISSAPI